jgi:hypothetical protein
MTNYIKKLIYLYHTHVLPLQIAMKNNKIY